MSLAPVCVLAGGLGTRLGAITKTVPKPLVEVAGRPFLEHQLVLLAAHGAREIVLCVGHLGEQVEALVRDGGQYGLAVRYSYDPPRLAGTAGAVRGALPLLPEDGFLVLYGDTYLRLDYRAVEARFRRGSASALMTVLRNGGRWGPSNATVARGRVTAYDKLTPAPEMTWIDYGLSVLTHRALAAVPDHEPALSAVFTELARRGDLAAYEATQRFYEIGSPDAREETARFLAGHDPRAGKAARNA
ncbi:MAG: sugar phosphate nucleotidyltransferase [Solirubrobacteraceae bacterium]